MFPSSTLTTPKHPLGLNYQQLTTSRIWAFLRSGMAHYSDLLALPVSFSAVCFLGLLQFCQVYCEKVPAVELSDAFV